MKILNELLGFVGTLMLLIAVMIFIGALLMAWPMIKCFEYFFPPLHDDSPNESL